MTSTRALAKRVLRKSDRFRRKAVNRMYGRPNMAAPLTDQEIATVGEMINEARYLEANPDVAAAGVRAAEHYACYGWHERRQVDTLFDAAWYSAMYGIPTVGGLAPMIHFLREGRWYGFHPYRHYGLDREALIRCEFSPVVYASSTPGARESLLRPVEHMLLSLQHGLKQSHLEFDPDYYLNTHNQLESPVQNPFLHYARAGRDSLMAPNSAIQHDYDLLRENGIHAETVLARKKIAPQGFYHPLGQFSGLTSLAHIPAARWFDASFYGRKYLGESMTAGRAFLSFLRRGRAAGHLPFAIETSMDAQAEAIRNGGFDADYYKLSSPAACRSSKDPLTHYLTEGSVAGHSPAPHFDASWYVNTYPGVRETGLDPYYHFLKLGTIMGYQSNAEKAAYAETAALISRQGFDPDYYLSNYPELGLKRDEAVLHYVKSGWIAGLNPCGWFSTRWYLSEYPDVRQAAINPLFHYLKFGRSEGRSASFAEASRIHMEFDAATEINALKLTIHIEQTARQRAVEYAAGLRDRLAKLDVHESASVATVSHQGARHDGLIPRMLVGWLVPGASDRQLVQAELEYDHIAKLVGDLTSVGAEQRIVNLDTSNSVGAAFLRLALDSALKPDHLLQCLETQSAISIHDIERALDLRSLAATVPADADEVQPVYPIALLRLRTEDIDDADELAGWVSGLRSGSFVLLRSDKAEEHKAGMKLVQSVLDASDRKASTSQLSNSLTQWQVYSA